MSKLKETLEAGAAIERHAIRAHIRRRYKYFLTLADKAVSAGREDELAIIDSAAGALGEIVSFLDKRIARYRKASGGLGKPAKKAK